MKTLVLVMTAWLPILADGHGLDATVAPAVSQMLCHNTAGRQAKKPRKRHSPLYYLRRAGQAEVGMAIRLSSWGIHDPAAEAQAGTAGVAACPIPAAGEDRPVRVAAR